MNDQGIHGNVFRIQVLPVIHLTRLSFISELVTVGSLLGISAMGGLDVT